MKNIKKIKRGAGWAAAVIILLAFPLFAIVTYNMELYDLSFIDRNPQDTTAAATDGAIDAPGPGIIPGIPSQNPGETSQNTTVTLPTSETIPASTKEPEVDPAEFSSSLYAYSTATGYGFKINTDLYTKAGQIITLVDGIKLDDPRTRRKVQVQVPVKQTVSTGGFKTTYVKETQAQLSIRTYGGYLIRDNGKTCELLEFTGGLLCDLGDLTLAYVRDEEGRPLFYFEETDTYYAYDYKVQGLVIVEYDASKFYGIAADLPDGYGDSANGLVPFFEPTPEEVSGEGEGDIAVATALTAVRREFAHAAMTGRISAEFIKTVEDELPTPTEVDTTAEVTDAEASLDTPTMTPPEEIPPADTTAAEISSEESAPEDTLTGEGEPSFEMLPENTSAQETLEGESATDTAGEASAEGESITESSAAETGEPPVEDTTSAEVTVPETEPETIPETTAPETLPETTPAETTAPETLDKKAEEARLAMEKRIEENGGLWGYKDKAGTVVIEPKYITAYNFNKNGLAAVVCTDGVMRFINRYDQVILDDYRQFFFRRDRYAYDGWYDADTHGVESLGMYYFDTGLVRVRRRVVDTTYSNYIFVDEDILIDANGKKFPIPNGYLLHAYSNGILLLEKDGKFGYMDTTGKWILDPVYTYATAFSEGLAVVGDKNGKVGMIDREGDFVMPQAYIHLTPPSNGIISAYSRGAGWQVFAKLS